MNSAHLHLALNHVPVIGIFFCLALALAAALRRSRELETASLWAFVVVALLTVPVYLTGEPAEEVVESLPGVTEAVIEPHEELAALALGIVGVVGIAALVTLAKRRGGREAPRVMFAAVVLLAVAATGVLAWTATLGGQIRHTEIRQGQ